MSLREANRSREKNGPWVAIAARDRNILSPEARANASFLLFIHFFLSCTFFLYLTDELSRCATILGAGGKREAGGEPAEEARKSFTCTRIPTDRVCGS